MHFALVSTVFIANVLSFNFSVHWTQFFVSWKTKTDTPHTHHFTQQTDADAPVFQTLNLNLSSESPTALEADSLILVELYNSTTASLPWDFGQNWFFSQSVRDWNGVTLDASGCVTHIELVNVGMNGPLPSSIGNLACLEVLDLGRNRLVGPIPNSVGNLSNLEVFKINDNFSVTSGMSGQIPKELGDLSSLTALWLDGNRFTDTIPKELGRLSNLGTLFLDENEFEGAVPDSFVHLTNLTKLDIFSNKLDSLPDLSSINSLFIQNNRFEIQNNRFTFDDILPNTGTALGDNYQPQDSILQEQTVSLFTGASYRIELGIDAGISNNTYRWYKDGIQLVPTTNVNFLDLSPVQLTDAGVYRCEVTNIGAPLLTLYSRNVTILVNCGTSISNINTPICQGEEIIINGNTYDCNNLDGTEFISGGDQYGCDSIINVMLTCSQPVTIDSMPTICPDGFIVVNGQTYDINNPEGWEVISNGVGCDTTIHVDLAFYSTTASSTLNETICRTDSVVVNGTIYNFINDSGTEILNDASFRGCDSVVTVDLNFYNEVIETFDQMLCSGGSITVNNVVYDESNPMGRDTILGVAENGCDSIVVIDLSFGAFASSNLDITICPGDSIDINGTIHDVDFPSSVDTLIGAGFNGCDSLIFINVDFFDENRVFFAPFLCDGEVVNINGTDYGQPPFPTSGIEIFDMSPDCDSIVEVFLNFFPPIGDTFIEPTLCDCEPFVFNGTTYDCNNPTGTEVVTGVAANGCDSTYQINLNYLPQVTGSLTLSICDGGSIVYNGTTYDTSNTSGTETVDDAAPNGCDSIVDVSVLFFTPVPGEVNEIVCEGESFEFNGTVYDTNMPTGLETLSISGLGGCDSTVNFTLSFYPENPMGNYAEVICPGSSIEIGGQIFDEDTPTGTVNVDGALNGCDSLVEVSISFFPEATDQLDTTICASASFTFNGTLYGNGGLMSGTEIVTGGSNNGCDVAVSVNVSTFSIPTGNFSPTICSGESFIFNGTLYGTGGLDNGTEALTSFQECDSLVEVNVSYFPASQVGVFAPTICANADTLYNGVLYDAGNASDLVVLNGVSNQYGCDSTVQVQVSFFPEVVNNIDQTLCQGTAIVVNGVTYDVDNPSGTETLLGAAENGCDSIVNIDLSFNTFVENNITQTLCDCDTILVNNVIYDCNNSTGSETLEGASYVGCDSIININLNFMVAPVVDFNPTLCPGETVIINGTLYSEQMSNGIEVFSGGTVAGCDSTVSVDINFHAPIVTQIDTMVCEGEEIIINGVPYNAGNTPSTEVVSGGAFTGCDSSIVINVEHFTSVETFIDQMLCTGQTITVGGVIYGDGFPLMGTEVIPMGSSNGCDSIIHVDLEIASFVGFDLNPTLCEGDFVEVNGNVYDIDTPMGMETFPGASIAGCDSIVNIDLSFFPSNVVTFDPTICEGSFVEVNGTIYDMNNPSGIEIFVGGSVNGCDSTVDVQLSFSPAIVENINPSLCECIDIEVNGTIYNCDNPNGVEMLQSVDGCDSIINVALNFLAPAVFNYSPTLCSTESELINGTLYYIGNPTGTEVIGGGSTNGCDSTINVNMSFYPVAVNDINPILCPDESIVVDGVVYDINNATGTTILTGAGFFGCDSTINIDLQFHAEPVNTIASTLCSGESLIIEGIEFNENNPQGSLTLDNVASNGCDSIINVDLAFHPPAINIFNSTLCTGESLTINGTVYDASNPQGTEILLGASANGCDSTINIELAFSTAIATELNEEVCDGGSVTINNTTYSTTGTFTETIVGGSSQGCDSIIVLNLTVLDALTIGEANAGMDITDCSNMVELSANLPSNTTGQWTSLSDAIIDQSNSANTFASGLNAGSNVLVWTLSTALCPDYDTDTLMIERLEESPVANEDRFELPLYSSSIELDLVSNDELEQAPNWTITVANGPAIGVLEELGAGFFSYTPVPNFPGGEIIFTYEICNADCPDLCDTAQVIINAEILTIDPNIEIPSGITPNDDGVNDFFIIPDIQENPDRYTESELVVFNRWGDVVYTASPYNNDWDGRTSAGKDLPQGTYYFVLRVDFSEGKIYKGDVTILK
ncbi:MAG: gliding motility-associated C-terminal domain-containing protein [Bacteroidota bacterium]